ncbi:MAG: efflux RND transporter permease subunit [Crocosphaera sp.]|nr:efflux RND transporter permease subunit [Crocosphaera sp.]
MATIFYRNLRLLILTIILILFVGLSSFQLLPRMEDPELISRVATITTFWPGTNAERVESLITEKLEDKLQEIAEIKVLESVSQSELSLITVELQDEITEVEPIWSQVRDKINDVRVDLPTDATEPEFEEIYIKAYAMLIGLTWEQDNEPNYAILGRRAKMLEDQLRSISGTEDIELRGEPDEEILVEINSITLSSLGLTPQQVAQTIEQSDAKVASGQLRNAENELLLEVDTELDSLERIKQIPLQSSVSSQITRVGDVALVSKGIQQPPSDIAIINGHPAIAIALLVRSNQRIDQWSQQVYQTLDRFGETLPSGLGINIIFDQTPYVENRLTSLIFNLLLGAGCVFAVTLLMMGWRSALIVGIALPLSGLMVFAGMQWLGIPLHQMSITGLIVALGLLIDNAIVVVDEVQNRLKMGLNPIKAIKQTVNYLFIPLLASTLTTVCAFLPIALLTGPTGEFVGTIGINVIIALIFSLLISLTIIPAITVHGTPKISLPSSFLPLRWFNQGFSWGWLTRKYRWSLHQLFKYPILGILLALFLPIIGFMQAGTLEEQFFPPADRDQFNLELEFPASTPLSETRSQILQARQLILEHQGVKNVHWFIGRSAPKFYYNLVEGRRNEPNYAQALVETQSPEISRTLIPILQTELDQLYPSARVLVRSLEQGPPVEAPVEVRLYGSNLEILSNLGEKLRKELSQVSHITHTRDSLSENLAKLGLQIDEEKSRLTQLSNANVANQLNSTLEGITGGTIVESSEELPVRVRVNGSQRGDLDNIRSLDLTANGQSIPLTSLGNMSLLPEINQITRRNGKRVNTVQGFIETGILPSKVLSDFQKRLENLNFVLPSGYTLEIGGESAERNNAVGGLLSLVGGLTIIMVATLVLSLGSFRLAGIIGVVGICSVGLGLFALWLFGYPFGFMAIIGSIGLVGVAINDSIVVLTAIKDDPEAKLGNPRAIREVVLHSTRHVLTTTFTTTIGFVPLLLGGGGFWPPLAVVIAGGIFGATLLALYFVPCSYLLIQKKTVRRVSMILSQKC